MIWNIRYFTCKVALLTVLFLLIFCVAGTIGCSGLAPTDSLPTTSTPKDQPVRKTVPHIDKWGIYALDIATEEMELLYSATHKITFLHLNKSGDAFAFSQQFGGNANENEEICTLKINSGELKRLTNNNLMDVYPVWSPDGNQIAFLSWRDEGLDIFAMKQNGSNQRKLYDSGHHDADIDWVGDKIVFTARSSIWIMNDNGSNPVQVTDPPKAGLWGKANLPFGDYDPRLSPDGARIVFERLENDMSPHGNYNIFTIDTSGYNETRLTNTGYSQGVVSWSNSGAKMVFIVGAIDDEGKYDIYTMNSDGSNMINITPDYSPPEFLCHTPVFSIDDSKIFFIGEWWE